MVKYDEVAPVQTGDPPNVNATVAFDVGLVISTASRNVLDVDVVLNENRNADCPSIGRTDTALVTVTVGMVNVTPPPLQLNQIWYRPTEPFGNVIVLLSVIALSDPGAVYCVVPKIADGLKPELNQFEHDNTLFVTLLDTIGFFSSTSYVTQRSPSTLPAV
jgi:hypothetical protein